MQDVDHFVARLQGRIAVLIDKPADDTAKDLPPALVTRPKYLLNVLVNRGQTSNPANHDSVGTPETPKRGDESVHGLARLRLSEDGAEPRHQAARRQVVEERFEEP